MDNIEFGFPAVALCQFCDNCGPQILLVAIYDVNKNATPKAVVPRETGCKICLLKEGVTSVVIDEQLYTILRHSCIYSLTAESPFCKFSTYADQEGWRLMTHFIVKDIYGRGNVRRLSLVFYSINERNLDIVDIAEKMSTFANLCRSKALEIFDGEKDTVSEWRMQSAISKEKHARSLCTVTGISPQQLCHHLEMLTSDCHSMPLPKANDMFAFDDWLHFKQVDFEPIVQLQKITSKDDFLIVMTKLVQGDQLVVTSSSDSSVDTNFVDSLITAFAGLLPSKLAQVQLIGDGSSASSYVEAWQCNLVALTRLTDIPQVVLDSDYRTLVLAIQSETCAKCVSKWLGSISQSERQPCKLAKRYTSLFSFAGDASANASNKPMESGKLNDFVRIIKSEYVLQSKLVYALTRLPDAKFEAKNKQKNRPMTSAEKTKIIEQSAQLGTGDLCQALFWASALSGEVRRRIVDTSDRDVPVNFASPEISNALQKLFLHSDV